MTHDIVVRGATIADGEPRYIEGSTGYHATLVNGQVTFRDGVHWWTRAGQAPRHDA